MEPLPLLGALSVLDPASSPSAFSSFPHSRATHLLSSAILAWIDHLVVYCEEWEPGVVADDGWACGNGPRKAPNGLTRAER